MGKKTKGTERDGRRATRTDQPTAKEREAEERPIFDSLVDPVQG
jgi:hypothetical protein